MRPELFDSLEQRRLMAGGVIASFQSAAQVGIAIHVPFARATTIQDVSGDIYRAIHDNNVPGGAAAVMKDGALVATGANGKRDNTKKASVAVDDRFHLGSSGKAMTSTMVARLIEEGKLDWNTTIATVFPELKGKITRSFEGVTVWQLMTNRSGLSDNVSAKTLVQIGTVTGTRMQQRAKFVPIILKTTANGSPGTNFEYSNFGYAVLGAMAERVTNSPFETLMVNYLFKPLKMDSAWFGAQGRDDRNYQPRGHDSKNRPRSSTTDDTLPYLAPAGLMSMSVIDWGKFLKVHMGLSTKGKYLLKSATLERLHTPYDGAGTSYAAGWVVTEVFGVKVLSHDGTNGNWYSTVQLIPSLKYAAFDVVNRGGSQGLAAAYAIKSKLLERVGFF